MRLVQIQKELDLVADALGDTPETVIPAHLLRRGLADAYVAGSMPRFDAVVVQSHPWLEEPWCFGSDAFILWELLSKLDKWGQRDMSPNVPSYLADPLSSLIQQEENLRVRQYGDVYHTLTRRVNSFIAPEVRQLEMRDADLLAEFRKDPHRLGFKTYEDLLSNGLAAGALVDGRLVALAHTNAMTENFGDIGVYTDDAWRGMGFASAAASIVARRIQDLGKTPAWSAGEDNEASLRIAAKLGFVEVWRRVYLNTFRA
ncbi:MAG: GNAT family N-acetyltransferase [Chloroflexi bacterium]|nr:GNAT family N-acetyltransferase [Chloroflexota bacterium]MYF80107.1 GNAT family N-acetyltransferase [Chloroflexota bacterium]MYK62316.1 GNAT family N-acetyltransferase [Chloroflexota bacterium]